MKYNGTDYYGNAYKNLCAANFDGTPCSHNALIIFEKVLRKPLAIIHPERRWDLNHCTLGIWGATPRNIGYKSSWHMFQQSYDNYSHSMKPEVIKKISKLSFKFNNSTYYACTFFRIFRLTLNSFISLVSYYNHA